MSRKDAPAKTANRPRKRAVTPAADTDAGSALIETGLIDTGLIDTGLIETGLIETGLSDTGLSDTGIGLTEPEVVAPAAETLIDLDPGVFGGLLHNRFDVTVRGRTVSQATVTQVRLEVAGKVAAAVSLGPAELTSAALLSDGRPARQRIFQLGLQRPLGLLPERCPVMVVATDDTGAEHAELFHLDIDPTAPAPVSIVSGPTRPAETYGGGLPFAMLRLERGSVDDSGTLIVEGWALAFDRIETVRVMVGGEQAHEVTVIGDAALGQPRHDVGHAMPAYPNSALSGFVLTGSVEAVDHLAETIRARMICTSGFAIDAVIPIEWISRWPVDRTGVAAADGVAADETGLSLPADGIVSSPAPGSIFKMYCDAAELKSDGTLHVNGWAVCDVGVAQVRVTLDDRYLGLAVFGHERRDVGAAFPEVPAADLSGFKFDTRIDDGADANSQVRVIVRNTRGEDIEETVPVRLVIADKPAAPLPAPPDVAPVAEQATEFRFELDAPAVADGMAVALVTGRLTIDGWLLSHSGIASFVVFLDDQRLGDVHYGLARQDVGAAFPEWPNSLRSGFAFHCPPRSLRDGEHYVRLVIRANNGREMERSFRITVKKSDEANDQGGIRRRVPRPEIDLMTGLLAERGWRPSYRLLLRQGTEIDIDRTNRTLESLRLQAYQDWSVLVLAATEDVAVAVRMMIKAAVPRQIDRFTVISPANAAWNAPFVPAAQENDGILFGLLGAGDEISADALLEMAVAGAMQRDADLLYGDEVRPSPVTLEREPFFKPDFSPDLLTATNYFGRPWVVSSGLLAKSGASPSSLAARGEYDLALRCAELARGIHHVPKLLCQRHAADLDDPDQEKAALEAMLARRGTAGEVSPAAVPGTWRLKRDLTIHPKVSVIIPTCAAHGYIETCLNTFRERTSYPNYEIIVVDNIPERQLAWKVWVQQNADKVLEIPDAFNWSIFNNRAAGIADGEYLLFLNDDIEITQDDWLEAMMEHAQRPEVGITGARLLYPDGKVQHAGMFLANNGIGRHAFRFSAADDPGYFGLALTQRNVMAVTGACLLVRRATFDNLGRFDEAHQIVNNDLDFCLRAHRAGLSTVFTPYATLTHHELASRAQLKDVFNTAHFDNAWKAQFAAGDPFFNPRLSRHADDYRPDDEPVQWVTPGAPVFTAAEIQRILVVKLDHIGDFVTALPPIRRLKQIFPHATITVLAGPASRAFVSLEPCIDEFIPFAFFHARSQLGERQLDQQDFIALGEQLRPYQFDLAVDLRKHTSTRDVLKYTGARFLAGFDYLGQFPYLDVALDWDGDRTLQRKRSHVIDDLLALVNVIGHAADPDRLLMHPTPEPLPMEELPDDVRALFRRPVVAIHPGAGNITKQWPTEHFAALIDLLIDRHDVNILLIGGPDEVEIAEEVLAKVLHPDAVGSMAGKTSLYDLPRLLLHCALYIGNDSGPKHLAAAVGIPTIGVHSGVVDPVEWGPLGPSAVALRRNMTCSPCYLANAEDCPRSLACLRLLEPNLVYEAARLLLKPDAPAIDAAEPTADGVVTAEIVVVAEIVAPDGAGDGLAEIGLPADGAGDQANAEPAVTSPAATSPAVTSPAVTGPAAATGSAADAGPQSAGAAPRRKARRRQQTVLRA